jgi:hypothetical protein
MWWPVRRPSRSYSVGHFVASADSSVALCSACVVCERATTLQVPVHSVVPAAGYVEADQHAQAFGVVDQGRHQEEVIRPEEYRRRTLTAVHCTLYAPEPQQQRGGLLSGFRRSSARGAAGAMAERIIGGGHLYVRSPNQGFRPSPAARPRGSCSPTPSSRGRPTRGVTGNQLPTLRWLAAPGAAGYRVFLGVEPDCNSIENFTSVLDTTFTVSQRLVDGQYCWQVLWVDGYGDLSFASLPCTFTAIPALGAVGSVILAMSIVGLGLLLLHRRQA